MSQRLEDCAAVLLAATDEDVEILRGARLDGYWAHLARHSAPGARWIDRAGFVLILVLLIRSVWRSLRTFFRNVQQAFQPRSRRFCRFDAPLESVHVR